LEIRTMNHDSPHALARPLPFRNMTGEPIPAFAVMAVLGVSFEHGIAFLKCGKPDATFRRHYAINGMQEVAAGRRGTCYRSGDVRALYDEGTPAPGESWGLRPGSWKLNKGFPGAAILGIVDGDLHLVRVDCDPITNLLAKTTATVPIAASTTAYRLYAGTPGSEIDAGFTAVPNALNHSGLPIGSGEWVHLTWIDDAWQIQPLRQPALCAVPPCGLGIPARVGTTPGSQECCLFQIQSGTLTPVLDGTGAQARGTVYNIREQEITPRTPPDEAYVLVHADTSGRWVCESPLAGTTTTLAPGATTTTTSTTPHPMCVGTCKWNWSIGDNAWSVAESNCLTGSVNPTPETTTTTTGEPLDCLCPTTTTTTPAGTTTSTTSTTTTTTPSPCECQYPTHCGTVEGECTYTFCASDPAQPQVACTTTTEGVTTTTCAPDSYPPAGSPCDCNYRCTPDGWVFIDYGDCPSGAPCTQPSAACPDTSGGGGVGGGSSCIPGVFGGGGSGSGSGGGGGCNSGSCESACYWWNPVTLKWELVCGCGSMICDPCTEAYYGFCTSEPPSRAGSGWQDTERVPCKKPCTGERFTTTPDPCGTGCKYQGDGADGWSLLDSDCGVECTCSVPVRDSLNDCETVVVPCARTTTTIPPTTTTTTTTIAPTTTTTTTTTTTAAPWYCNCFEETEFETGVCVQGIENVSDSNCGGPYASQALCEAEAPCTTSTTTTTAEPVSYYCCGDPLGCIALTDTEFAGGGCSPYHSGPHNTSEDCTAVCVTTTTTTTTCDPTYNCNACDCVMPCPFEVGAVWGAPAYACGGPCVCDPSPTDLALVGTSCAGFEGTGRTVNACNPCEGSTEPCVYNTTTTVAP
jgi:hypothetical protein